MEAESHITDITFGKNRQKSRWTHLFPQGIKKASKEERCKNGIDLLFNENK